MTSLTPTHDLPTLVEGDDIHFPVSFSDPADNPIDITDWTVSTTVKPHGGQSPAIQKDITTHSNPTDGETGFEFQAGETAGLTGSYRYDIQVIKPGGEVRTVVIGNIAFIDGVTDRTPGGGGSGGDAAGGGVGIAVALGTDSIAVDVAIGAGTFGASDARAAIDGATITPSQVGTQSNPVQTEHVITSNVDELSVGNGNPVSSVTGDTGEFVYRDGARWIREYQTSKTSYDVIYGDPVIINFDNTEITNADKIYVELVAQLNTSTDSDTVHCRLFAAGSPYAEISASSSVVVTETSGLQEYTGPIAPIKFYPQIKVSGGSGSIIGAKVNVYTKIGTQQ